MHTVGSFTVSAGERIPFTLTHLPSHKEPPVPVDPETRLAMTEAFWGGFCKRCPEVGPWTAAVKRSLITRSEEHTSELQSLMRISYAVFCLKNKRTTEEDKKKIENQ